MHPFISILIFSILSLSSMVSANPRSLVTLDGDKKSEGDPPIGNWTLIQRWHVEKSDAFKDNGWIEYRNGFGEKSGGEYWMGLENMRQLLETDRWQLFIGIRSLKSPTWSYIIYNDFRIGEEIKGYRLHIGSREENYAMLYLDHSLLEYSNGCPFSTRD